MSDGDSTVKPESCVWTLEDFERSRDETRYDQEYWSSKHNSMWWKEGDVAEFNFCPYCGKPIEREGRKP